MAQQTWEYQFVQFALSRGFKNNIYRPFAINDKKIESWERGPSWQEYFQKQGAEGWEFVAFDEAFLTDSVIGGKLAIFKRRIISAEEVMQQAANLRRVEQAPLPTQNKPPFVLE